MGRSIIADEAVEAYINKLVKTNKWFVGVIIGQLSLQRDYVVHVARTPDPVENEVSEENGENDTGDNIQNAKKKPSLEHPSSLEQLDGKWVSTHAKQVSRMLPGGLSVVGLFAIAPSAMLKNAQGKLKQMLFAVHKQLSRNNILTPSNEITDRILLQMDTSTKKLSCVTLDVADIKSVLRPAEWKFQSGGCKWVQLNSHITLDIPMAVPTDSKAQTLLKQIQNGLADFSSSIQRSIVAIEGTVRDPSDPLVSQVEKKGKATKGGNPTSNTSLSQDVSIFLPFVYSDVHKDPVVSTSQATINMMGTVVVRAYVSTRATVAEAVEAIKVDIIRSLMSRCELLCEEFDVTEEKQGSEIYDPPVRLFCQLPHCGVDVCDYVFQDEKQEEVKQRIQELLDVDVDELEESEKSAADDDTWSRQSSLSCMSSHQSLVPSQPDKKNMLKAYVGAAVGGIVALAATWLSYTYMNDE
ncbi:unnamed protein product [Candidula unifasciata]|uniref:Protein odr-4 homolog n=1 Tax=Candidula unifasciata TaxID=100452 RepID=A0A8S3Z9U1_9EUPU|nr:unnamed protein product [Candidula unifasciata]